ncbi:MAG: response regulator [Clostridium sp.]|nr:response regulator [Clostridium sp.]
MIKVVVVEDEDLIRKGIVKTTLWSDLGCVVVGQARNGIEGINIIKEKSPNLVITDVRMPRMDGIEMIDYLKDEKDIQYIIISGYDDFKYAQKAIRLGVKDYLLKPVDDDEFHETIRLAVDVILEKQHRRENKTYKKINKEVLRKRRYSLKKLSSKEKYYYQSLDYIKNNYKEDISIKTLSDFLYISESYLSRIIKEKTGLTFGEHLLEFRIKKSKDLLKSTDLKVYEIAYLVGYNDARYFSSAFKKETGRTPTEYRDSVF